MKMPITPLAVLMIATLGLAACSSEPTRPVAPRTAPGGAVTAGLVADRAQPPGLNDPNSPLSQRVIYFDYDNSNIKPEFVEVLRTHARYIATTPKAKVMLEGHTDERGTREYNLALGERRANAAKNYLASLGVDPARITTVSYGKERPVALESTEEAWARNRRAVTVTID